MLQINILLTLIVAVHLYAQTGKLIKAGAPQPAAVEGYHKGHCVALPNHIRLCKLLSDNADVFLVEKDGKALGTWPSTAYLGETEDFEVLRGDLDGDRQPELIVANRDATGNGMGISVWTIAIFPDTDFRSFHLPLTFHGATRKHKGHKMKLLIIGGTRFLGRHLARVALAQGHEVTLFNRGNHPPEPFTETIQGDRHNDSDLAKLKGGRWDVVIDTSGQLPRSVRAIAEILSDSVDLYVFISTQNAYASVSVPGVDETFPLATLTKEQLDQAYAIDTSGQPSYESMYGGLKALSEQAAEDAMPNRVLVVRPGLIVGPYDYTDRFTYWPVRVARGGEVLAPGRPERFVQFIDVRDLSEWLVSMAERRAAGVYNANREPEKLTMQNVLAECKLATDSDASFTWVSEDFLLREKVAAWSEMPLWLPESAENLKGFMFVKPDKAIADGLRIRPLTETIRDTLTWYQTERAGEELKTGISSEREQELLRKWHEASTG